MKVRIRYETSYRYAEPVSYSPHFFRLFPKPDTHLRVERFVFETNAGADVQHRCDLFDNIVARCFYPGLAPELWARVELDLELEERNAFHFVVDPTAAHLPFAYEATERRILEPYLRTDGEPLVLPFWKLEPEPTVQALVGLNNAIFEHLQYERRGEGAARSPRETLALGRGACRDYAVLLAETLRGIGVAARLASGYLRESGEGERRAEGALHAWVEAYLPGAGWIGMDPTNGLFANHSHIATAVGLAPEDITPVLGTYYSNHPVACAMSSALQVS
jgi:transglutaminase-like putative cysteine protease